MFFQIDESVLEFLQSDDVAERDIQALSCFLMGVAEGSHRIGGHRRVLTQLAKLQIPDSRTKQVLMRAAGRVAKEGSLLKKLRVFGRVVVGVDVVSSQVNGSQRVITFPLRWFDVTAKIQPVTLLAENLSDIAVLKIVGEVGAILATIGHLPVKVLPSHGGGSTTGVVLRSIAHADRICLCVVDSDKQWPGGSIGTTALAVSQYKDGLSFPLIEVIETSGRDLENSLPNSFYIDAYGRHPQYAPMSKLLSAFSEHDEHDARNHIDIEKGLVVYDALGNAPGSAETLFWRSKLPFIINKAAVLDENTVCVTASVCTCARRVDCSCIAVPGIKSDVLRSFAEMFKDANRFELRSKLDDSVRSEWSTLGACIASWCCGDSPLRI